MTAPAGDDWRPDPQLLAAYLDGELDGGPEREALRRRVEDWLDRHPEARAELAELCRLRRLWREAAPPEPAPGAWDALLARIDEAARRRPAPRRAGARIMLAAAAAACVALLSAWGLYQWARPGPTPRPPAPPAEEAFPVASAAEVEILHVEGADAPTLVVGRLPLQGPLELAGPGEVALTSVQPDAADQMVPHVRTAGPHRPMIWARLDADGGPD